MPATTKKTVGLAIASLVMGCLILIPILGILFALLAIVFGIVALVQINGYKETLRGSGLATSGIILGGIGLILVPIMAILLAIAIPNFIKARDAARVEAGQTTITSESYSAQDR